MKRKNMLLVALTMLVIVGFAIYSYGSQRQSLCGDGVIGCKGWVPEKGCHWYGADRPGNPIIGPLMPNE